MSDFATVHLLLVHHQASFQDPTTNEHCLTIQHFAVIMAPSVILDTTSDFAMPQSKSLNKMSTTRTLLLSPPSLSSHPEKLDTVVAAHDRTTTDIQMLDRLSLSLVSLPDSTYDIILILADADDTRSESHKLLNRDVLSRIAKALKPGGKLQSQDGKFATEDGEERREAIFAGLVVEGADMVKPKYEATQSVPLRFGKKKDEGGAAAVTSPAGTGAVSLNLNGKRKNGPPDNTQPAGVGFVDFGDDFSAPEEDDDDLIDEDMLLDEDDLARPVVQRKPLHPLPTSPDPFHFPLPSPHPLTNPPSTRMPPQDRKTPPRLQRLHLRPGPTPGSRRRRQTLHRGPNPRETQVRRAGRSRLHRTGQGGQLWELRAGRCVSVRWVSVCGIAGF